MIEEATGSTKYSTRQWDFTKKWIELIPKIAGKIYDVFCMTQDVHCR
jgi:hypothetical protein